MLRRAERLLAVAAVLVLGGAAVSTVTLDSVQTAETIPLSSPSPSAVPPSSPAGPGPTSTPPQQPAEVPPAAEPPSPPGKPSVAPRPTSASMAPAPAPAPAPLFAAAAPEPPQEGCPLPQRTPRHPYVPPVLGPPAVADADLPAPLPAGSKAASLDAVAGKGIWVTNWPKTELDVPALVGRTRAAGLRTIWVRTGGSRQRYYGDGVLPQLVPAAHAAGLQVVAWDFPSLSDPFADVERARAALEAGIDGFAPDIETTAEGTYATAPRVALYLSHVRAYAGSRPVAATVPRPTPTRLASFPYSTFEPYADVFTPMVY